MTVDPHGADPREAIAAGRTAIGIELGSTRIKAVLIGPDHAPLASGSHDWENQFVDRMWTYSLDAVWSGLQASVAALLDDAEQRHGVRPTTVGALGVSAMMHGYLAFDGADELLVPQIRTITTLAGYVHWKLTGRKVLGIGDASGLFPIDTTTKTYDARMLAAYPGDVAPLLPEVLLAGQEAGRLTEAGAALLDPTGTLQAGIPLCPPEGDAGTGMVATNAVAPRTGNVSVGTSIFAMVVLEQPLATVHDELDLVTTPSGELVAMVHCNNGASELGAWADVFGQFATALGSTAGADEVFGALLREALRGDADGGGLLAYNYLSGEPITGLDEGRPLFVRTPDSRLTLANFARTQVYSAFGTLRLGMRVLADEGVELDSMYAHGGLFRTEGVAQRLLAAAIGAPVTVGQSAGEGGAWGIAVLAAYLGAASELDLSTYLTERVFGAAESVTVAPDDDDLRGFDAYLARYSAGLAVERAAVDAL